MIDDSDLKNIPVVDIFAGPGGLSEGFSSFRYRKQPVFNVCLSIEKDYNAYRTLRLRSFFRRIPFGEIREPYLKFARSSRTEKEETELFSQFKSIDERVQEEVLLKELGSKNFSEEDTNETINKRIGKSRVWVLIGGPPCQAYSVAGRSRMSKIRKRDIEFFEKDERHYLYQHYLKIIGTHKPPVFVMENVRGILSSKIQGESIFNQIISDLKSPNGGNLRYELYSFSAIPRKWNNGVPAFISSDYLIKAEAYGIPQRRHRVIILGLRSDLGIIPEILKQRKYKLTLKEVISDLPMIISEVTHHKNGNKDWNTHIKDILKSIDCKALDHDLVTIMKFFLNVLGDGCNMGAKWMPYLPGRPNQIVNGWYRNEDLGGICNHESRCHMPEDLQRYFFSSCFALLNAKKGLIKSPQLYDFPGALLPKHENVHSGPQKDIIFDDRFRVQLWNAPATTITSHIAKDGHYYIHPDPSQCRSLSVREAARIQTFPDNFIFLGNRTAQYQQVGNAVPPFLARQLANIVFNVLLTWKDMLN